MQPKTRWHRLWRDTIALGTLVLFLTSCALLGVGLRYWTAGTVAVVMVSLVLLRWRELVWLIVNGPSLAEFFRVLSGKTASILEARAECRTARREFKEAQANLKAANAAMNEAARAARVADYAEDWPFERISPVKVRRVSWQEVAAKMNPADETTKAFIAAAKALDKAESEAHKATREYERTLARL